MCIDVEGTGEFHGVQHMFKVGIIDLVGGTIYSGPYTTVPLTHGKWYEAEIIPYPEGPNGSLASMRELGDPVGFHVFASAKAACDYAAQVVWCSGSGYAPVILRVSVKGKHSYGTIKKQSNGAGIRCQVVQFMKLKWR